ncbi:MAG: hypothetical protein QHH05_08200 [Syntrophomonadaceae bacterium]|nr:hypothetical protein [Syntrophomonadaceae bacterium]MDH7498405.1 hypothetical protein [Syntrophomonadaceae bacterium]
MREAGRWAWRLLVTQALCILAVWLGSWVPGLETVLAGVYLLALWQAGREMAADLPGPPGMWAAASLSQLPGWMLTVPNLLAYLGGWSLAGDYPFLLEVWHTPWLPLVAWMAFPAWGGYAAYFLALLPLSALTMLVVAAGYAWGRRGASS